MWRRGSATDHDCDNEILSWLLASRLNSPCKQSHKRWMSSVGVLRERKTTNRRAQDIEEETLTRNPAQHVFISNWPFRRKTRGFIFTENTQFYLLLALTQGTCKIKEKLVQLHCRVAFSSSAGSEERESRGSWACLCIGRVARVAFDNHVRLQGGARAATWRQCRQPAWSRYTI